MAKRISFVSPIGTAVFPHITQRDTEGKYATKKYGTRLELSPEDFARVKAELTRIAKDETFEVKTPKMPFKKNKDEELCQIYASTQHLPLVIDSKKNKIVDPEKIKNVDSPQAQEALRRLEVWGGSRIRLGCSVYNYGEGLSLQLETVQVIEARKRHSTDGFDVEDDGYEYEEPERDGVSNTPEDASVNEADEDEIDL